MPAKGAVCVSEAPAPIQGAPWPPLWPWRFPPANLVSRRVVTSDGPLCCIALQRLVPAAHAGSSSTHGAAAPVIQDASVARPSCNSNNFRKEKKRKKQTKKTKVITFWGGISPAFTQPTGEFVRNMDCGFVQRFLSYTSTGKMACLAA